MNKKMIAITLVVVLIVAGLGIGLTVNNDKDKTGPITVTDGSGTVFTFEKPCERVIVYSKYIAEAMILMSVSDLVVGTTSTVINDTNYSSYYTNATDLGTKTTTGMDIVLTLNADVIISYNSNDNTQLVNTGIPVVEIGAAKTSEVIDDITTLGKILGKETEAKKILDWYEPYYNTVTKGGSNKTTFALESSSKTKLTFCNPTSTPGALLETAGGTNVFTETSTTYTYPEGATLLQLNPDVIIVVTYNSSWDTESLDAYLQTIYARPGWSEITAVQNGDVYMLSNDIVGGIRSVIGAMFMLSFIDSAYENVNVSDLVNEYNAIAGTDFNNVVVYTGSTA